MGLQRKKPLLKICRHSAHSFFPFFYKPFWLERNYILTVWEELAFYSYWLIAAERYKNSAFFVRNVTGVWFNSFGVGKVCFGIISGLSLKNKLIGFNIFICKGTKITYGKGV